MPKKQLTPDFMVNITDAAERMQAKDVAVERRLHRERGHRSTIALDQIQYRESDTRPLNPKHVVDLMQSISALGLIEPLVIDQDSVLLAGAHRLAAIELLQQISTSESIENSVWSTSTHGLVAIERLQESADDALLETLKEAYTQQFPADMIPVRIMKFVAAEEPERALRVEIAENEQRRDYTPTEVRNMAERLRSAGYVEVSGRPKKGESALMPALSVVVGKSRKTLQRYLYGDKSKKSASNGALFLKDALRSLKKWEKNVPDDSASQELLQRLPEFMALIEAAVKENPGGTA